MKPAPAHLMIEIHLTELDQLYDPLAPLLFRQKDLNPKIDQYIIDRARELGRRPPREILLHLSQGTTEAPNTAECEKTARNAIHDHFARRAAAVHQELRRLMRRGLISFAIGLSFLAVLMVILTWTDMATTQSGYLTVLRESMIILGWVAMWRPLEILLYDWWPLVGQRKQLRQLSRTKVRLVMGNSD